MDDQDRWRLVENLFDQALQRDSAERREFLRAACNGDQQLFTEVEELLTHHELVEAQSFLQSGVKANDAPIFAAAVDDPYIGMQLGSYVIKRRHASGGMGNVYLALRQTDFRQQVAIKVLRRGMDSEDILGRFRHEIQVLAALSKHPHIAALQDAGSTKDGLPFFVMEYVEGEPVDAYCDKHNLTVRQRIQLFLQVCEAVDFAHRHMVIHRDLKSSNILVRTDGIPKLIDFGIAKLTTPEFGAQTLTPTMPERRFMTMEYASPEQVRGESLTTASDVYSLGVILYELMTGRKPYKLQGLSLQEQIKVVAERDPEQPSKAVCLDASTNAANPDTRDSDPNVIASRRGTTAIKLARQITGDLENILLKALHKDPQQRYEGVDDLSEDLQSFLDGSPVQARPIGRFEKFYRWSRQNPVPTALFSAVIVTFAIGIWHFSRLSEQLIQSTAVEGAALEAETLAIVQDYYSKVVVDRVKDKVPVTHRYAIYDGAIPVPASFTIDLGEHIRKSQITTMFMRLYSEFPFRHREGGGPKDEFQTNALRELRAHPDKPYYRFENFEGRQSLRYAAARIMQEACVNCHNQHPDSTRKDWRVGEVRGVLEIIRPLDRDISRTQKNLRETFYFITGVSVLLIVLALFFLRFGKNRS
jgi:serine/threonine protein kinase